MKCDEFNEWLQNQLDERHAVVFSRQARKHLSKCHVCRDQLNAWKQIASILPVHHELDAIEAAVPDRPYPQWTTWVAVACAAVLCFVLLSPRIFQSETSVVGANLPNQASNTQSSGAMTQSHFQTNSDEHAGISRQDTIQPDAAQNHSVIDPSRWWQDVQKRDWINLTIDNTKPTVESMRNGVAPLGRSLVIAVALLTRIGGDQTS
jgi:hypothetical protein